MQLLNEMQHGIFLVKRLRKTTRSIAIQGVGQLCLAKPGNITEVLVVNTNLYGLVADSVTPAQY